MSVPNGVTLPGRANIAPPMNPVLTHHGRSSNEEEEEDEAAIIKQGKLMLRAGSARDEPPPLRPTTPAEKDMWNQSLYLPSEFSNPPERRDHGEEDDFVTSLQPIKDEHNKGEGSVKSGSPRLPMGKASSPQSPAIDDVFKTDLEANVGAQGSGVHPDNRRYARDICLFFKWMLTWQMLARFITILVGVVFFVFAVLLNQGYLAQPPVSSTNGVALYRWLAFGAISCWCYPVARLVVVILEVVLWYAEPKWTTSAYYYLKCCRVHVALLLVATGWLIAWSLLILNVEPGNDTGYFYGTQLYWLLFIGSLLLFCARLAKELSASYFERTTFWSLVSENLKREYLLWACCPGTPVPSPVVLTYFRAGEEATRSDPRVLRQCTKYLRRQCMTGYSNVHPGSLSNPLANINAPIEISETQDVQDLAEIIFDHVTNVVYGNSTANGCANDEDCVRNKLKAARAKRGEEPEPAVRTIFTVGQNILPRTGSAVGLTTKQSAGTVITGSATEKGATGATKQMAASTTETAKSKESSINRKVHRKDFEMRMFVGKDKHVIDPIQVWETLFDPNKRGYSSRKYFRNTLLRLYNDRLGLGHTLKDSQTAVDRLGSVYYGLALVGAIVAAALLFAGASSYNVWIGITSFFVTLAVVFGNSLKVMAENIVYIFFRHPFDVGDLLSVNGNFFSVRKLELLSTTLIRWNGYCLQIENSKMAQMEVFNLSRSGLYWELLEAHVDIATATESFMANVRQHLGDFIRANPDIYSGKFQVIARALGRPLQIRLNAFVEFAYRPVNLTKVFEDVGKLNECFAGALRKYAATEAGVGLGAVRAGGDAPVNFLIPASGLFGRAKAISDAVGL